MVQIISYAMSARIFLCCFFPRHTFLPSSVAFWKIVFIWNLINFFGLSFLKKLISSCVCSEVSQVKISYVIRLFFFFSFFYFCFFAFCLVKSFILAIRDYSRLIFRAPNTDWIVCRGGNRRSRGCPERGAARQKAANQCTQSLKNKVFKK